MSPVSSLGIKGTKWQIYFFGLLYKSANPIHSCRSLWPGYPSSVFLWSCIAPEWSPFKCYVKRVTAASAPMRILWKFDLPLFTYLYTFLSVRCRMYKIYVYIYLSISEANLLLPIVDMLFQIKEIKKNYLHLCPVTFPVWVKMSTSGTRLSKSVERFKGVTWQGRLKKQWDLYCNYLQVLLFFFCETSRF